MTFQLTSTFVLFPVIQIYYVFWEIRKISSLFLNRLTVNLGKSKKGKAPLYWPGVASQTLYYSHCFISQLCKIGSFPVWHSPSPPILFLPSLFSCVPQPPTHPFMNWLASARQGKSMLLLIPYLNEFFNISYIIFLLTLPTLLWVITSLSSNSEAKYTLLSAKTLIDIVGATIIPLYK